jgi:hypothetical protein
MRYCWLLVVCLALAGPAVAEPPSDEAGDLVESLLSQLGGFEAVSEASLQAEVAELGGVPFKHDVRLNYLPPQQLKDYLRELFDEQYPAERAALDQRLLRALDLIGDGIGLRELRFRLLEQNVIGFYDERPGRRALYAVSEDRSLSPMNQLVLAHELRHALQDQYSDLHGFLPKHISDFDDRSLAFVSVLEGDALLVMQLFISKRLPGLGGYLDFSEILANAPPVGDAPPIVSGQLTLPYSIGVSWAGKVKERFGWEHLRNAWRQPPETTEQVMHLDKYLRKEGAQPVSAPLAPEGGRLLLDGVLGEAFAQFMVEGAPGAATEGWGGDRYQLWDVSGRTLVAWRSVWDSPADELEFHASLRGRLTAKHGRPRLGPHGEQWRGGEWTIWMRRDGAGVFYAACDAPEIMERYARAH